MKLWRIKSQVQNLNYSVARYVCKPYAKWKNNAPVRSRQTVGDSMDSSTPARSLSQMEFVCVCVCVPSSWSAYMRNALLVSAEISRTPEHVMQIEMFTNEFASSFSCHLMNAHDRQTNQLISNRMHGEIATASGELYRQDISHIRVCVCVTCIRCILNWQRSFD